MGFGGGPTRRKNSLHPEGLKFRTQLDFLKQPQHAKKKTLESDIVHSKVDNIDIFRSRGILSTIGHSSSGVAEWTIIWPLQPPSLPENSVDNIVLVRSLSLSLSPSLSLSLFLSFSHARCHEVTVISTKVAPAT